MKVNYREDTLCEKIDRLIDSGGKHISSIELNYNEMEEFLDAGNYTTCSDYFNINSWYEYRGVRIVEE